MKIEQYLDAVKQRHGLKTDTELGKVLGVRQNAISQYRNGTRTMDNEMCLHLAQLLEMENPLPIIMAADLDRAERAGQRSLWEVFSPRMAHSATAAILVLVAASVTNFVTPSPAEGAPFSQVKGERFALCKIRRRLLARLQQALRAVQARVEPAPA